MTNERCQQYINNDLIRPLEALDSARKDTGTARAKIEVKDAVVLWYKCDLRTRDNKGLYLASEKAKSKGVPLICVYIISPQDFKAHMTSPVRVDFILRTLEVLKEDLGKLDIPLYVETVEKRKAIPKRIYELCEEWGACHLFANIEYEVDELRRDAGMVRTGLEQGVAVEILVSLHLGSSRVELESSTQYTPPGFEPGSHIYTPIQISSIYMILPARTRLKHDKTSMKSLTR